jgi:hypothetical protein
MGFTMSTGPEVRNGIIDQAQEQRKARDTLILQKVNRVHREAFRLKFPTACEHMMRMVSERLQLALANKPGDIANLDTWKLLPHEIRDLSEALYYLNLISKDNPILGDQNESA